MWRNDRLCQRPAFAAVSEQRNHDASCECQAVSLKIPRSERRRVRGTYAGDSAGAHLATTRVAEDIPLPRTALVEPVLDETSGVDPDALGIRVPYYASGVPVSPTHVGVDPSGIHSLEEIPFLPVELFKTCRIYAAESEPEQIFTSSSTSGQEPSKHYVASLALYEEAFTRAFEHFYGPAEQVALFALLPSYLEREGSSLIYMADRLIARGGGGFYLHDHEKLRTEYTFRSIFGRKTH